MCAARGSFIRFELTFRDKTADQQARAILAEAQDRLDAGALGVGITYSANLDQTGRIRRVYADGEWNTGTSGANQASVMTAMEALQTHEFASLQGKVRIVPITTMSYGELPTGTSMDDIVVADLAAIRAVVAAGWTVLGWINESGSDQFAVGGGVAAQFFRDHPDRALSPAQSAIIQAELARLAAIVPGAAGEDT